MADSTRASPPDNPRTLTVLEPFGPDGRGLVRITARVGRRVEETTYRCTAFSAYDGAALGITWEKEDGTTYTTCLDGYGSRCECLGFLRWGHRHPCKHIDAGHKLKELGLLVMPSVEDERALADCA